MKRLYEYPKELQKKLLAIEIIDKYLEYEGAGGSLHVVLSDGNYDSLKGCKEFAEKNNDVWALILIELMKDMNHEEIEQLVERSWEIYEQEQNL